MSSLARSLLVVWVSTFGCTGVVGGPAGDDSAGDGTRGGNAIDDELRAIDDELAAENPELFAIASEYFPGLDPAPAKPRVFRLTRSQFDITVQSLLPAHFGTSALASLPRDPLEKNYEYSANLGFSPANFTPYVEWVAAISESVRNAPATVIDCSADDDACLRSEAKAFVARAFRGVTSEAQLERYADLFSEGALEVGVADATAELVDVALASPSFRHGF